MTAPNVPIAFVDEAGGGKLSAYVDRNLGSYPPAGSPLYASPWQPQSHDAIVNARIAAFPRAVEQIRNTDLAFRNSEHPLLSEKDILRLAVELVK